MYSANFDEFDISTLAYKVVNGHGIKTYVLTPKNISPGKHPVAVKFHGGFFVSGRSLYPGWYPQWALDYCVQHSAIIVTGDYRLLPESTGADLYEDISDFWDWIRDDLQIFLDSANPGVEVDLDKVMVHGESAGGTISLVSAFSQPRGFIKAVIPLYPAITMIPKRDKPIFVSPPIPESVVRDHMNSMPPGTIVSESTPPDRMDMVVSIAQKETIHQYYGTDERHDVWKLLEKATDMPYMLILHGSADWAVPVEGSVEWVAAARKKFGGGQVKLHIEPGGQHGFDRRTPLGTSWLEEGLRGVTEHWLGGRGMMERRRLERAMI